MKLLYSGVVLTLIACLLAGCGQDIEETPFINLEDKAEKQKSHLSGNIEVVDKTLSLKLQVPDAGWKLKITEVYVVGIELWAVVEMQRSEGAAAQVITTVEDSVTVKTPDIPVTYYVLGAPSGLSDLPFNVTLLPNKSRIAEGLAQGRRIYPPAN